MKTNTPPNSETQDRIQQLKLGVDWHADHFRAVRMCGGQSPQPAQRFTPASFLLFVQKQLTLADQVFVVYEAGPGGFHLHRQLAALGVRAFVVHPVKLDPQHKGVVTDKTDARELALKLDRYLGGNLKAMSVVRVPTPAEEQRRALSRQREQLRRERQRLAAQGRSLCLTQGIRLRGQWWQQALTLPEWLIPRLDVWRKLITALEEQLDALTRQSDYPSALWLRVACRRTPQFADQRCQSGAVQPFYCRGEGWQRSRGCPPQIVGPGIRPANEVCPSGLAAGSAKQNSRHPAASTRHQMPRLPVRLALGLAISIPQHLLPSPHPL
jgi:hypothetical protein